MKKLIIIAAIMAATAPPAIADGWAWIGGQTFPEKKPEAAYRLKTAGWDTRVYEWTPEGAPGHVCVAQFAEKGPVGMQCFPKDIIMGGRAND